jgi:hypothetical protein
MNGFAGSTKSAVRFLAIAVLVGTGISLGQRMWEAAGGPLGSVGWGLAAISGVLVTFLLTWLILLGRILVFYPFPTCRRGKCHSIDDYDWSIQRIYGRVMGCRTYHYWCRCGDEYVRKGRRFMEFLYEDSKREDRLVTKPYKVLTGFRTWSDEPGEPE